MGRPTKEEAQEMRLDLARIYQGGQALAPGDYLAIAKFLERCEAALPSAAVKAAQEQARERRRKEVDRG